MKNSSIALLIFGVNPIQTPIFLLKYHSNTFALSYENHMQTKSISIKVMQIHPCFSYKSWKKIMFLKLKSIIYKKKHSSKYLKELCLKILRKDFYFKMVMA